MSLERSCLHLKPSERDFPRRLPETAVSGPHTPGKAKAPHDSMEGAAWGSAYTLRILGQDMCGVSLGQNIRSSWDPFKGARLNPGFLGQGRSRIVLHPRKDPHQFL